MELEQISKEYGNFILTFIRTSMILFFTNQDKINNFLF